MIRGVILQSLPSFHQETLEATNGRDMTPANRSPRQDHPHHTQNAANPPIQLPRPYLSTRRESWNRSLPLWGDNHERYTYLESPQSRCGCVHKQPNKDMCTTIIGYQCAMQRGYSGVVVSSPPASSLCFIPLLFSHLLFTSLHFLFNISFFYFYFPHCSSFTPPFHCLFLFKGS